MALVAPGGVERHQRPLTPLEQLDVSFAGSFGNPLAGSGTNNSGNACHNPTRFARCRTAG